MVSQISRQKLLEAIDQCQLTKIITLIRGGHNIHVRNIFGQNFLIHILQQQQQDPLLSEKRHQIFQFLITNYNLNIHSFDYYGKNLFNWATNLNCTQEALYLLNSYPGDIDILVRDHKGSCSLHYAVEHGNEILVHAIVNYLLRYRLRFDIKDAHNHTPEDLAKKLGYDKIGNFLAEACRSTIYLSREVPFQQQQQQQQLLTDNSKLTVNTNSSTTIYSSLLLDSSEYFNLIERKVNAAKNLDDWKTVLALRAYKRNLNEKTFNKMPEPIPQTNRKPLSIPSFSKFSSTHTLSQSEQMLHLIEPQISSSFRQSFIPNYQRSVNQNVGLQCSTNVQRRMSQTSSRRVSSVLSQRKRDSDASQMSISVLTDIQNRITIPPVYKQHRQSIVTTN